MIGPSTLVLIASIVLLASLGSGGLVVYSVRALSRELEELRMEQGGQHQRLGERLDALIPILAEQSGRVSRLEGGKAMDEIERIHKTLAPGDLDAAG